MADQVVTLRITADSKGAIQEIVKVSTASRGMGEAGLQGGQRAASGLDAVSHAAAKAEKDASAARNQLIKLIAAAGGLTLLAKGAISYADSYSRINSQLRLVTDGEASLNRVRANTFEIAQRTRSEFESTAVLYARLTRATEQLGTTEEQRLRIVETINKSFAISNAGAQEMSAAIIQLSQGLAAGALRGDEFNSVNEQAPKLMDLLAASLGKTKGELRAYAEEGKLTASVITRAFLEGSAEIDQQFATMTSTIGQAWTQFGNELLRSVGETNSLVKGSEALIAVLGTLAKNIDTIAVGTALWAAGYGAAKGAALVLTLVQQRVAATALAEAEAQAIKARAMGASVIGATALANAETRLAAAQAAATAAGVGKIGMLSRLGSSLLSLAGGPIGVAVIALGSLVAATISSAEEERKRIVQTEETISTTRAAAASLGDLADQLDRVADSMANLPSLAQVLDAEDSATRKLAAAKAELVVAQAEVAQSTDEWLRSGVRLGLTIEQMNPSIVGQRDRVERLSQTIDDLQGSLDRLDLSNLFNPSTEFVAGDQLTQITATLQAGLASAEAQILKTKESTIGYWQELAKARIEQAEFAGQSPAQIAALEAENQAWLKTIASTMKKTAATRKERDEGADFIAHLKEQIATYEQSETAALRYAASTSGLTAAQSEQANALIDQLDAWGNLTQVNNDAADALDSLRDIQSGLGDDIADMRAELGGASKAQIEFNRTQREAAKSYVIAAAAMDPSALDAYVKAIDAAREKFNLTEELDASAASAAELKDIFSGLGEKSGFDSLVENIERIEDAIRAACDVETVKKLQAELDKLRTKSVRANTGAFIELGQAVIGSMKDAATEGSRHYAALEVAQSALALGQGINAILTQGQGDPYTAFGRMAAMAAVVIPLAAQLGASISNFGSSGFSDTAAQRQATQGTGSVLGDSEADSESIANGVEITANATSQLVALNRGMLNALNTLVAGLGSAANMLARGAGSADFSGMNLAVGQASALNGLHGHAIDPLGIFGGASKVTDEGIIIFGGALTEMLNSIAVGAYQEVQSRSWAFGSTHTNEGILPVSDAFANQFQLIIGSIIDTVREGATALGLLPADIQARLDAFTVEEIRISLQGLSAEEAQAEIAAVLSEMFDGVTASVVPFIGQFQRVGEGLGETLIRVATGVQVTQEAMRQLGLVIDETDPERFAQISEALIDEIGGIDDFISQMGSFVANFSTDAYQFQVASDALHSAFAQAGLTLPATSDGMWDLMRSLDATTEEGRAQIAMLLRLSDVEKQYYDLRDKQLKQATDLLESLGLSESGMSEFTRSIIDIRQSSVQAAEAANTIAIAQGRQGASATQLARIRQWTLDQEAAAIRRLQQQTQDYVAELFGGLPGSLDGINAQIAEIESTTGGLAGGIDTLADAGSNLFEQWRAGIQSVQDYLDSMLLGDLSALTPEQQLDEARRQLEAMQQAALGGDVDALNSLPQLADAYLRLLRGFEASGSDFNAGFDWVRELLQEVVGAQGPIAQPGGQGAGTVQVAPSAELIALYAARDALLAEQEAEYRRGLAEALAQNLRDLATLTHSTVFEVLEVERVALADLATELGVNLQDLTASSVDALGHMAATLGVSLTELTGALGLTLTDLSEGLRELTESVGIDLANLTVESTQSLALLATSLGADLTELATSLGIDLGSLADSQSLLNEALAAEISTLPAEQSALLEPLLAAIAAATTDADANSAIAALEDAVNLLAPDIRTQLAPYLAGVFPADALSDLDYLSDIQAIAYDQLDTLVAIRDNLRESNRATGLPSYAVGTGFVMGDQIAQIHHGEAVVPAPVNAFLANARWGLGGGAANDDMVDELRAVRAELALMRQERAEQSREERDTIDQVGNRSDRNRERALSDLGPHNRALGY